MDLLPCLQKLIKKMAHAKRVSETVILDILWEKVQEETQEILKPLPVFQRYSISKRINHENNRSQNQSNC